MSDLASLSTDPASLPDRSARRRWLFVLPAIFVTYSLAYLDRANYGVIAAGGFALTLHISASDTALLSALFFLGYFVFQVPGAAYARRHSCTRVVFAALILWGTLAALTGIVRTFWLLAADRFLLGVAESVIFPAMLVLITKWFTRAERSRANTILILANPITVLWMSALTGYLIHALGWQKTFVVEGLPSLAWAMVWLLTMRDQPSSAKWITPAVSEEIERRLASEQKTVVRMGNIREALRRREVIFLVVFYFGWNLTTYGFILWIPTIIRSGAAIGIEATGLLSAAPYALAIVLMIVSGFFSDRTLQRKLFVWPALILSAVALFASSQLANHHFWMAYAALILGGGFMYAPYGPFFAFVSEVIPQNVLGEVLAVVNSSGAAGGFAGAWLIGLLQARTGGSRAGFLLMSLSLLSSGLIMLLIRSSPRPAIVAGDALREEK